MTGRDWYAWHQYYDDPDTSLAQCLAAVQGQIRAALDAAPPGPLHVISLCAGQGRCRSAGISFELEVNNPAPGWSYRRLLIRTPGGYRLALEGPNE